MSEQWTEWIKHDGKGCPCVGMWVQCVTDRVGRNRDGTCSDNFEYIALGKLRSWDWSSGPRFTKVIRYRIRKPDALIAMIERAENLPPVKEPTHAD